MKLFIMTFALAVATVESLSCYSTADKDSKDCDAADTKCFGPKLMAYTGYAADVKRGCGECADNDNKAMCETCTTDDCNKAKELSPYKCYKYTVDDKKQSKADDSKTYECSVVKGGTEKQSCINYKSGQDDMTYAVGGCGVCPDGKDKTCEACEGNLCNGTLKMGFNLFILFAVIKALL